jgi:outer membrane PBP1 activator LpoA protein
MTYRQKDRDSYLKTLVSFLLSSLLFLLLLYTTSCRSVHSLPQSSQRFSVLLGQSDSKVASVPHGKENNAGFSCDETLTILETSYRNRNFEKSMLAAAQILQHPCSSCQYFQVYETLGDISYQKENAAEAILFFSEAVNLEDIHQQKQLLQKSLRAALKLSPASFVEVVRDIGSDSWRRDLLFEAGRSYMQRGQDSAFLAVLGVFCKDFPDDRRAGAMKREMESLKTIFNRHRIGVLLPLSGTYQNIGYRVLKAIEIAVNNFNNEAPGRKFQIIVKDTGADSEKAVMAVKAFEKEGVAGIIGPIVTAAPAAMEANRLGIPMIVMTQKKDIPRIGEYIFRSFLTPEIQADALVSYLSIHIGAFRFAILYPDESYGVSFKDAFVEKITQVGGELTGVESYQPDQTDFALQISKFIKGYEKIEKNGKVTILDIDDPRERHGNYRAIVDFEVLFIPDAIETAAMIAPQLRYHDINDIVLAGTNLWASDRLVKMAGPYVQGAIFPTSFDNNDPDQNIHDFISEFASGGEPPPGFIEAIGFDTTSIMLRALCMPETESRKKLLTSLFAIKRLEGLTGMSSFTSSGEPVINLKLCRIVGNKPLVIQN